MTDRSGSHIRRQHTAPAWPRSWRQWWRLARGTWNEAGRDNIGLIAAGVAFYGFLALVPLLAAIVLTYGLLADTASVIHDMTRLTSVMPPAAAHLVGDQLLQVVRTSNGRKGLGVATALAIALFGVRNGVGSLITALNVAHEATETRGFIALNLLALAIATISVVTILIALAGVTLLVDLEALLPGAPPVMLIAGKVASYGLLVLTGIGVATALYRYGPSRESEQAVRHWAWFSPGAVFCAGCWLLLTLGFGTYAADIGHYNATYGSLSAVVIMLTWLYLSSYVLLFGAELNAELARQSAAPVSTS